MQEEGWPPRCPERLPVEKRLYADNELLKTQ
jgi:hypothetical protein